MATTRLKIYNGALLFCSQRSIASLTVAEESRRLLDDVYNDGGIDFCLEQAQWKFATKASKLSYETAVTPDFGYRRAFAKPTDWKRTVAVCQDEYFRAPLLQYSDEIGYLWSDLDEIYVKYVSNAANYGLDFSRWPASFTEYVKAYFAWRIAGKLTGGDKIIERLQNPSQPHRGIMPQALLTAKNHDAMDGPAQFAAQGSWSRSRQGGGRGGPLGDGGHSSSLIG